jgi:heterodisulfide reductase subunit A2
VKIGVYFCNCGTNVSEKIDPEKVRCSLQAHSDLAYFKAVDFLCSESGAAFMESDVRENQPDRVVVAACSVRDHEETFRGVLCRAGMNPFLMQMVNIREHVAWVTASGEAAGEKAARYIRAAMGRVKCHEPIEMQQIEVSPDVLIIGAGPAGLKAALTLAEAGRKVCLVEKAPVLGGLPVMYEEVFPNMECGPCMLEPVLADILHGPHSELIEVFTLAEVTEVVGYFGKFTATIRKFPRYISPSLCIACSECIAQCPVSTKNPYNFGLNEKKAVDFPFQGALPNIPYIDPATCVRMTGGQDCSLCRDACLVDGAVVFDDPGETIQRDIGAILVATGAGIYDCSNLPNLGYGRLPDVYTSLEFERILAASGPTAGAVRKACGAEPKDIAIIQCVGSLDSNHKEYCSALCCENAFKFNSLIAHKLPNTRVTHFYRTICVPGKEEHKLYETAKVRETSRFVQFDCLDHLSVHGNGDSRLAVRYCKPDSAAVDMQFDMVVLCPAIVPSEGTRRTAQLLELDTDRHGFLEEMHGRMDSARSKMRGIYLAGTCQAPMDIQKTVNQSLAATGYMLSALVPGRKLTVEPVTAMVDAERCSGCRCCIAVCPYKAISLNETRNASEVNPVLCLGCGTCVAACPSAAIAGKHFTNKQILAEIEEVLA